MSITIVQGDLLAQKVDAIVNPANSFLRHGGGLARKIAEAATPEDDFLSDAAMSWHDEHAEAPMIPTGGCHVTSAGALPFKAVIHAVGPIWGGGHCYEDLLLMKAHDSVCRAAIDRRFGAIAIPAISCGIFGYPVEQAASIAVSTCYTYRNHLAITFVLFEDSHYAAYQRAAKGMGL